MEVTNCQCDNVQYAAYDDKKYLNLICCCCCSIRLMHSNRNTHNRKQFEEKGCGPCCWGVSVFNGQRKSISNGLLMHRILASRSGSIRKLYPTTPTAATVAPLYEPKNKDERRTTHAHKKKGKKRKDIVVPPFETTNVVLIRLRQ